MDESPGSPAGLQLRGGQAKPAPGRAASRAASKGINPDPLGPTRPESLCGELRVDWSALPSPRHPGEGAETQMHAP